MGDIHGSGEVEVYKLREMTGDRWTNWKYRASSSNRYYADRTRFSCTDYSDLGSLVEDIMKIFDKDENIVIASHSTQHEPKPKRIVWDKDYKKIWQFDELNEDELAEIGRLVLTQKKQLEESH